MFSGLVWLLIELIFPVFGWMFLHFFMIWLYEVVEDTRLKHKVLGSSRF